MLRRLWFFCTGPHPERHPGRRGCCGDSSRDDADPLRLPHCRRHLWHCHDRGVCLYHGKGRSGPLKAIASSRDPPEMKMKLVLSVASRASEDDGICSSVWMSPGWGEASFKESPTPRARNAEETVFFFALVKLSSSSYSQKKHHV